MTAKSTKNTGRECVGCTKLALEHHGNYCYLFRNKPNVLPCAQYSKPIPPIVKCVSCEKINVWKEENGELVKTHICQCGQQIVMLPVNKNGKFSHYDFHFLYN